MVETRSLEETLRAERKRLEAYLLLHNEPNRESTAGEPLGYSVVFTNYDGSRIRAIIASGLSHGRAVDMAGTLNRKDPSRKQFNEYRVRLDSVAIAQVQQQIDRQNS